MKLDLHEFKKVEALHGVSDARGILSVYLPIEPGRGITHGHAPRLMDLLKPLAGGADPATAARIDEESQRALAFVRDQFTPHGATLALFSCAPGGVWATLNLQLQAPALARNVSTRAALAQAANVLRFDAAGWFADNTDGIGLVRDIEQHADFRIAGARVLLIGAGGAASGVLGPLIDARAAEIVVANRTRARAAALVARHHEVAGAMPLRDSALDDCGGPFDLVINSTSSSMQGIQTPVPAALLRHGALAIDLMYGPAAEPFLDWARSRGAQARDGLGMLVEQAAEAFYVWRGVRPHTPPVLRALREHLAQPGA